MYLMNCFTSWEYELADELEDRVIQDEVKFTDKNVMVILGLEPGTFSTTHARRQSSKLLSNELAHVRL